MSEAEDPQRLIAGRQPTLEDLRELAAPSTPAFALQLRERVRRLIAPLPADHPVRAAGEQMIAELDALAMHSGEPRGALGPGEDAWHRPT